MLKDPIDSARLYLHGLASLHLGRELALDRVDELLEQYPLCQIAQGEAAFREGEAGNSALLVIRGMLEASVRTAKGERLVGSAGPWDVVGETALYAPDRLRSATVRGRTETTCLRLNAEFLASGSEEVIAALEAHLLHTLSHRIRVTNLNLQIRRRPSDSTPSDPRPILTNHQSPDLASCAGSILAAHPCMNAKVADLRRILESGEQKNLAEGEILCDQGSPIEWLYFLLSGAIDVDTVDLQGHRTRVGSERAPAVLGHIGLIDRTRRGARCTAKTPSRVIQLHSGVFWDLMRDTGGTGTALRRLLLSSLTRQLVDGNERIAGLTR